jgi:hypothetical protein
VPRPLRLPGARVFLLLRINYRGECDALPAVSVLILLAERTAAHRNTVQINLRNTLIGQLESLWLATALPSLQ